MMSKAGGAVHKITRTLQSRLVDEAAWEAVISDWLSKLLKTRSSTTRSGDAWIKWINIGSRASLESDTTAGMLAAVSTDKVKEHVASDDTAHMGQCHN